MAELDAELEDSANEQQQREEGLVFADSRTASPGEYINEAGQNYHEDQKQEGQMSLGFKGDARDFITRHGSCDDGHGGAVSRRSTLSSVISGRKGPPNTRAATTEGSSGILNFIASARKRIPRHHKNGD